LPGAELGLELLPRCPRGKKCFSWEEGIRFPHPLMLHSFAVRPGNQSWAPGLTSFNVQAGRAKYDTT